MPRLAAVAFGTSSPPPPTLHPLAPATAPAAVTTLEAWLAGELRAERLSIGALLERRHEILLYDLDRRVAWGEGSGTVDNGETSIQAVDDSSCRERFAAEQRIVLERQAAEVPTAFHDHCVLPNQEGDMRQECQMRWTSPRLSKSTTRSLSSTCESEVRWVSPRLNKITPRSPSSNSESEVRWVLPRASTKTVARISSSIAASVPEIIDAIDKSTPTDGGVYGKAPLEDRLVPFCDAFMACVVGIYVLVIAAERQYASFDLGHHMKFPHTRSSRDTWPGAKVFFQVSEWIFSSLFAVELIVLVCVLRFRFLKSPWRLLDLLLVTFCMVGQLNDDSVMMIGPSLLRMVKIIRLVRLIKFVRVLTIFDPLHLLVSSVRSSVLILFWSLVLLLVVILGVALGANILLHAWIMEDSAPLDQRQKVFAQWGSFSRSTTTMFEITLGNWGPPCRLLENSVSEWWAVFIVGYKCVIGFAVVQIITSVFIQQTFKIVARDEQVMLKESAARSKNIVRNLDRLFQVLDVSKDGTLSRDEIEECISNPTVKAWLRALEIDVSDVIDLFDLLDCNGDATIDRQEFIDGLSHFKRPARNLEILHLSRSVKRLHQILSVPTEDKLV